MTTTLLAQLLPKTPIGLSRLGLIILVAVICAILIRLSQDHDS